MSSRVLRWLVLGFACLWFGMLVPVHNRGQIKLPGAAAASAAPVKHCAARAEAPCHKPRQSTGAGTDAPARGDDEGAGRNGGGGCAVCHFIAGLHAPPPVTEYAARLGLLPDRAPDHVPAVPLRHAALPFHGLDPPAA